LVELVAAGEDVALATVVALVGGHLTDTTVAMLAVVPVDETGDPALRGREVSKRKTWVRWRVLQGAEESFGV
jgi:hypothetical protein